MDPTWLDAAGRLSLYVYSVLVAGCLIALIFRSARARAGAPGRPFRPLARRLVEYVGNLELEENDDGGRAVTIERRTNVEARLLVDFIRDEMSGRETPPVDTEQLIEGLREAMRLAREEQPR